MPVRRDVAMTGEITLRGNVLPVGGIKEKLLAAHRAGIKRVIMPERNQKDMIDVPEQAKNEMEFLFVKRMDEVLALACRWRHGREAARPRQPTAYSDRPSRAAKRRSARLDGAADDRVWPRDRTRVLVGAAIVGSAARVGLRRRRAPVDVTNVAGPPGHPGGGGSRDFLRCRSPDRVRRRIQRCRGARRVRLPERWPR